MLKIGTVIDDKYKILSKVGQGGMSVVYLALNERANKTWAVKEVRKDGRRDFSTVKQRLITETEILKSLRHKYLPSIVDVIEDEDVFILVMDYIEGKSLMEFLREGVSGEDRSMAVRDVLCWGTQLCEVLYYLHTRQEPIVYRDMKPSNIMLKPDGEISLIDFGTARIFKEGNVDDTTCLGTPGYAAPEQYGGHGQSCPQSDIYGLGATLHHLITGRNPAATPFYFPRITQCRPALLEETPREMRDALLGLEMIIGKCTQYKPEDRYSDCAQLKYDLEHPGELGLPYRRRLRKKMLSFLVTAGMALVMGSGSFACTVLARRAETKGYAYYVESAATAPEVEKLELYRKAVALKPQKEDAWLGILETMGADNWFSAEEDSYLLSLLSSRDNGRVQENKALFRRNEGGYVRFAYNLGMLYYYAGGGGGNKSSAGGWFGVVCQANLSRMELGEDEGKESAWKARAEILGKICQYNSRIGQTNQAGDAQISYRDYWKDLMALADSKTAGRDNVITELRLYNEIVYQICTHYDGFWGAGVSRAEMEKAITDIEKAVSLAEVMDNPTARELKAGILEAAQLGRNRLRAMFAANAVGKAARTTSEGGDDE